MDKREKFPHSAEVDSFKQTILKTAEDLVINKFPKKIVQLNKMLSAGKLTNKPSSVYQKINVPVPDVSERDPSSSNTSQQSKQTPAAQVSTGSSSSTTQIDASNGETGVSMRTFFSYQYLKDHQNFLKVC